VCACCRGRERSGSPHRRARPTSRRRSRSRSRSRSKERHRSQRPPAFLDMEYGEYRKNFNEVCCHCVVVAKSYIKYGTVLWNEHAVQHKLSC